MSNQDQWSREARTIALSHCSTHLKSQRIRPELVESIPCLGVSRYRYINIVLRNRCIENLLYQQAYNDSKEVGMLVQLDGPYNVLWLKKGDARHVKGDDVFKNILATSGYRRLVFIHNHPTSQSLQADDMTQLLQASQIEAVIAVGNSCDRSFAMLKNNSYNVTEAFKALKEVKTMCGKLNNFDWLQNRVAMNIILSKLDTIGLDYITNNWWEV